MIYMLKIFLIAQHRCFGALYECKCCTLLAQL